MSRLFDNLDRVSALAGLALGAVLLLVLWQAKYGEFGIALALACVTYLAVARRSPFTTAPAGFRLGRRAYLLFNIAFFTIFTYSMLLLISRSASYVRPTAYFVAVAVLAALLALEAVLIPDSRAHIRFCLAKILLLAMALQWVPQIMFPSLNGIDVWGHAEAVMQMLATGRIAPTYVYADMPVMPFGIGTASLLTGLSYKFAGILYIGTFYLAIVAFVFVIGERLFDFRVGLLSALMVGTAGWYIHNGLWAIPNTLGIALVILLTYLVFSGKRDARFTALTFSLVALTVMTHALASFAICLIFLASWGGQKTYGWLFHAGRPLVNAYLVIFSAVVPLAYWAYISGQFRHIVWSIKYAFQMEQQSALLITSQYLTRAVSYGELVLSRSGLLLYYFLAIIGILALLSRGVRSPYRFCFASAGIVATAVAFAGGAFRLGDLLPDRFLAYSQILLGSLVAVGVILLVNSLRGGVWKYAALLVITGALTFLQVAGPHANRDSPVYVQSTTYRTAFTHSEVTASRTISSLYRGRIMVEIPYNHLFDDGLPRESSIGYLIEKDFENAGGLLVIRDYNLNHVFPGGRGFLKLDYDLLQLLSEQGLSRLYDSGAVIAYLSPDRPSPESR